MRCLTLTEVSKLAKLNSRLDKQLWDGSGADPSALWDRPPIAVPGRPPDCLDLFFFPLAPPSPRLTLGPGEEDADPRAPGSVAVITERSIRESSSEERVEKKRNSASGGTAVRTAPLPERSAERVLAAIPPLEASSSPRGVMGVPGRRVGRPMAAAAAAASVREWG